MSTRGSAREKNGHYYARARYGRGKRLERRVPWAKSLEEASERGHVIGEIADKLIGIGRRDLVRGTAEQLAAASNERRLASVLKAIAAIVSGAKRAGASHDITFEEWSKRYTSGELAEEHPDHVRARDHKNDLSRLKDYILPHISDVPITAFQLAHAQLVMTKLPKMSEASRRQVAQIIGRLMHLAVFPGQLIKASPLPRGWLPKITKRRHYSCLYPREEAMLLRHAATSECFRLFCGVLNREGMRLSELLDGEWWQWNLDEGTFQATKTKTGDPRMWAVRPDVATAMREWKKRSGAEEAERAGRTPAKPFAYVLELVDRTKLAELFRRTLKAAGVKRAELFDSTEHTGKLRAHDMRATFVTVSLAEGKSETWIRDRTAHKSTSMIDRYRRTARQFSELKLGSLVDLVDAIGWGNDGGKDLETPPIDEVVTVEECTGRDSNPHALGAVEPKCAQPISGDASGSENTGEDDVPIRCETRIPHASPTPLATARDARGGTGSDELDSSMPPTLARAASALEVEREQWRAFDALDAAHMAPEQRDAGDERELKRDTLRGPAKARALLSDELDTPATGRGGGTR